ncbi:MAG: hypothetical protein KJT03_07060, partial [Verrucomicrobiae bacterium]|nr:hypothetical protein [Verrucomicrobiae bacterium]
MRSTAFTMNRLIFCFLAVIYSSGPTLAGHNLKQETVYFEPLMGYKELPNLTVNAIHQDVYGLIWIGTNDGLVCYNGSDYRNYKFSSKDETSISSKKVTAIGECPVDGDLWIATSDGLNLFDRIGDKFERYPFKNQSGESVSFGSQCIGFDSAGNVLVGTFFGLPILNCTTKEWDLTYTSTGRFDTLVKDIHKTAEDEFLLATTSGFHKLSLVTHELSLLDESPRHPNGVPMEGSSVLIDELQRLWLGTLENGVHVFDSKGKPLSMSAKGSHYDLNQLGSIQYIKEDHHENIWIGSLSEGLFVAASGNESLWHFDYNPSNSQAIPAKLQNTALVTENGKLLFGTKDEGIYFYDPSRQDFEIFNRGRFTNRGLILSNINKAVEETSGKVWLGGGGRRLNRFNPLTKEFEIHIFDKFPEGEKTNGIYAWCIDRNNWMWIISRRGNLYTWDFERDLFWKTEIRAVNFEPEPGLLQAQMYADSQGMLWFMGNGLYKFNPRNNEMELIGKHDRIPSRRIAPTAVFETAHGDLWFGTQGNGFYFYSRNLDDIEEGYMPDLNPELLTDTRVTSLYQENEDYLWIATESGLGRFHTKRKEFDNPDFLAPLLDTGIYGLQPDEEGDLWAMTAHDLTKIDLGARQLLHYDEGDGLLTANFSGKPFLKLQSGSFLIGGDAGFNLFYPEYINPHAVPGKVTINKIEVIRNDSLNHSPLELPLPAYLSKRLELSADQNFLTIHYASMDPGKSARVNYATRLVGLENNWSPASKLT